MKFLSESMTSASGSIGGATYSHNRSGMYRRARRVPVNPNTTFQQSQRDAFSDSSALWRTLTAPQRAAWESYAAATPLTNSLGSTFFQTGAQAFVGVNALLQRLGFPAELTAPVTPGRAAIGMPTVVLDESADTIVIAALSAEVEGGLIGVFLGDPQSAGVSFFKGPYQLRGSGSPTLNTFTVATASGRNGLPFVAGQRIPYRLAGLDANSRLSQQASGIVTVVA